MSNQLLVIFVIAQVAIDLGIAVFLVGNSIWQGKVTTLIEQLVSQGMV